MHLFFSLPAPCIRLPLEFKPFQNLAANNRLSFLMHIFTTSDPIPLLPPPNKLGPHNGQLDRLIRLSYKAGKQ